MANDIFLKQTLDAIADAKAIAKSVNVVSLADAAKLGEIVGYLCAIQCYVAALSRPIDWEQSHDGQNHK